MIYKDYKGLKLSALGMGAMRLPVLDGDDAQIDEIATEKMIACAMRQGINYFDTAWGYHGGQSEIVMGKLLNRYPREEYYLADKFPGYSLANMDKVEIIFEKQLKKCGVDYFDFYMLHNVCEINIDAYLDEQYGIMEYLRKQKEAGRLRRLGFSAHGGMDVMKRFLSVYGAEMEFCQIQLNYLDWTFQDAKGKTELLAEHGIPVWVMEPLRGGRLASLANADVARLKELRPEETVPAWAFRFLQTLPGVVVTLSGMSNFEQLAQNMKTYGDDKPLTDTEMAALLDIADGMVSRDILPCTACRYCVGHCPQELDIPNLLSLYNEHAFSRGGFIAPMALAALPENKRPGACAGCASCEEVCPQQLRIAEAMGKFSAMLGR